MSVFTKIEEHNLKIDMEPQKTADQLKKKIKTGGIILFWTKTHR